MILYLVPPSSSGTRPLNVISSVLYFGFLVRLSISPITLSGENVNIAKSPLFTFVRGNICLFTNPSTTILLVDSNLQRENILPSEKSFAYQMKLEAMKRKAGRPSQANYSQIGNNFSEATSSDQFAQEVGESKNQIFRYIRLTNLIDPILEMVDNKQIALNAAVEISYLGTKEQVEVHKAIESEDGAPSIEQAKKIRRFFDDGKLNPDVILSIMQEEKPEKIKITLGEDKLKKYFPKGYTKQQIEAEILRLLENAYRKKQHGMER